MRGGRRSEVKEEARAQPGPGDMSGVGHPVSVARSNLTPRTARQIQQRGELDMSTVLNAPVIADVPVRPFEPGPAGTHITIRGLTKYFAGWPLYENFDLDIPKHRIVS